MINVTEKISPVISILVDILVKNPNIAEKSKFWSKIEIWVKNRNIGQKSKFWSKNEFFVKNRNFGQKFKFVKLYKLLKSKFVL